MPISAALLAFPPLKAYFFEGSNYFRYDVLTDRADPGFPAPVAGNWPGVWKEGFDTAATFDNKAYFFRGSDYIRYDLLTNRVDDGYPKPIQDNWKGVWGSGINAAVKWSKDVAYFFKGSQYIRYDLSADHAVDGYPKPIAGNWPGLWAEGIDAAVVWNNGKAYFFKNGQYIRYDIAADRSDAGYPLPVAGNWPGLAPVSNSTTFDPAKDGFKFVNSFDIDPRLFGFTGKNWNIGLCGGMCAAALDRWVHKQPIPAIDHVPQQKCPDLDLFWEIFGRQAFTLYPLVWLKVLALQVTADADTTVPPLPGPNPGHTIPGLGSLTAPQWPKLKDLIDRGIPAILVLIRAEPGGDPTNNHQVVAIGYRMETLYDIKVQIYDPNHPGQTQELEFDLSDPAGKGINGKQTDGHTFRAFFIDLSEGRPYEPAHPVQA